MKRALQRKPAWFGLAAALAMAAALTGWVSRAAAESGTKTDPKSGISVTIPSTWVFADDRGCVFSMHRTDNPRITACLALAAAPKRATSRSYAEGYIKTLKRGNPDPTYTEITDGHIGTLEAALFASKTAAGMGLYVLAVQDKKAVSLVFAMPMDQVGEASILNELESIKQSVAFPAPPGETRRDPKSGIRMTLPSTWNFTKQNDCVFSMQRTDAPQVTGCIASARVPKHTTSRSYAEEYLKTLKDHTPGATYTEITDDRLGGSEAALFESTTPAGMGLYVLAVKGKKAVSLVFAIPVDQVGKAPILDELNAIKNSVKF